MGTIYQLSFAKIIIIQPDIAEVIVNQGIEMNMTMVNEYHQFLFDHLQAPFCLLINKINDYTYDFEAQMNLANLEEINAMAVVSYSRTTEVSTNALAKQTFRESDWNLRIFTEREDALNWLRQQQCAG